LFFAVTVIDQKGFYFKAAAPQGKAIWLSSIDISNTFTNADKS